MKQWVIIVSLFLFSCSKDKAADKAHKASGQVDAVVIWSGLVAADGCDWYIKTGETTFYHPDTLPEAFKQHNLSVKINYKTTEEIFSCGWGATMPVIQLLEISK